MAKKILLIDDDLTLSEAIKIFLREEGFRVKSFADGNNIELKIKSEKPDLLLLDFQLPGKNGTELTRLLRRKSVTKDLPIIMIAANQIYKGEAKSAGVTEFLDKPFDLYELLNTVRRYTNI